MDNVTPQSDELMRYFDKEMSDEERRDFEAEINSNPNLKEELSNLELARKAITMHGINEEIAAVRKERTQQKINAGVVKMYSRSKLLKYAVAAAAIIIIGFFSLQKFGSKTESADSLYAQEYSRFEPSVNRGSNDTIGMIEKAYVDKKYSDVTKIYSGTTVASRKEMIIAAISYLELGNSQSAVDIFIALLSKNKTENRIEYNDDAMYYLGLAYLKNKDYAAAADMMKKVHDDDGNPYHKKFSTEYINEVKSLK